MIDQLFWLIADPKTKFLVYSAGALLAILFLIVCYLAWNIAYEAACTLVLPRSAIEFRAAKAFFFLSFASTALLCTATEWSLPSLLFWLTVSFAVAGYIDGKARGDF